MPDPIQVTQAFLKDVEDLGKRLDELSRKFQEGDLSRIMNLNKASADMKKFMEAVTGVTEAQQRMHRVEKELEKARQKQVQQIRQTREELDRLVKKSQEKNGLDQEELEHHTELKKRLEEERKELEKIEELQKPEKIEKLTKEFDGEEKAMKGLMIRSFALKKAFDILVKVFTGVYSWADKLQQNLGALAERFGAGTDAILHMADTAKREFLDPKGLGGMGFKLEEVNAMLGDFREQMVFTGKVTDEQALRLVKWGKIAGMTATETGELSRSMYMMGQSVQDTENFLADMVSFAGKAGVSARAMSKSFTGAGKSLLELTGPRSQDNLKRSAAFLLKMGMSLDKLKGFVDMSDSFDQVAESVAGLNTVFGTTINAAEIFAEQDPAKRIDRISQALKGVGMTPDAMRQEKRFLMDRLHLTEQDVNALIKANERGEDYSKILEEQAKVEEDRAKVQESFDALLTRGKKTLIAWGQLAANFYDKFNLKDVVGPLTTLFDGIMDFVRSDAMVSLAAGLGDAFRIIGDIVNFVWPVVALIGRTIGAVVGALLQGLGFAWKIIKWAVGKVPGVDLGEAGISDRQLIESAQTAEQKIFSPFFQPGSPEYRQLNANRPMATADTSGIVAPSTTGGGVSTAEALGSPVVNVAGAPAAAAAAPGAPAEAGAASVQVQLVLDGEVLQDKLYKASLRRHTS